MFCPKCGTNVDDSFNFCFKCGFDFRIMKDFLNGNVDTPRESQVDTLHQKEVSEKEYLHKVSVNNTRKTYDTKEIDDSSISLYSFEAFNGTQERYENMYNKLCYEEQDFEQLCAFKRYVKEKYSEEFLGTYEFISASSAFAFAKGKRVSEEGLINVLRENIEDYDINDIEVLSDNARAFVVFAHWYDVIGRRGWNLNKYLYEFDKDLKHYSALEERKSKIDDNDQIKSIVQKMKVLESKYTGWTYEKHILQIIEIMDIEHLENDIKRYAKKYASFVSDIYNIILNNAKEYHEVDCLNTKYLTSKQYIDIKNIVENEFVSKYRTGMNNLTVLLQKLNECKEFANNVISVDKNLKWSSYAKKVVIAIEEVYTVGLLDGIIYAAKEGISTYEQRKQSREMKDVLDVGINGLFKEYYELIEDLWECHKDVFETLKINVSDKFLLTGIVEILNVLEDNNENLLSLEEYLED